MRYLAEGLTNREIGERLGLSQHTIKNHLFPIFDKLGVSNRTELLFKTLNHSAPAPGRTLLQSLLTDPTAASDEATLAFCEKAAEHGVVAAQLLLARSNWTGRAQGGDVVRSHMWLSVALDLLTRAKNDVKKAMSPAQLAEAERQIREQLNKTRGIALSLPVRAPSSFERTIVA